MIVLWRQRDDDPEQWTYLERMLPGEFSYEIVKQRWGGGAYRIRLFGAWDRTRRQEKYITQVAFWIWRGFPPTPALRVWARSPCRTRLAGTVQARSDRRRGTLRPPGSKRRRRSSRFRRALLTDATPAAGRRRGGCPWLPCRRRSQPRCSHPYSTPHHCSRSSARGTRSSAGACESHCPRVAGRCPQGRTA